MHFRGDRWLRFALGIPTPEVAEEEISRRPANATKVALPFEALRRLREHVGSGVTVMLCEGAVSTAYPAEAGDHVLVPGLPEVGAYPLDELLRLDAVAFSIGVEGEGDAFWESGALRGRVLRSSRPRAPEAVHRTCPTCRQEWP